MNHQNAFGQLLIWVFQQVFHPVSSTRWPEAQKSMRAGAYTASVAMTGRALEAIGRHFHKGGNPDKLMLAAGIEELYANKVIDERLYGWSKELHLNRNLAAHASMQQFSKADAEDLFNFASAICDYIFVLSEKFETYKRRKADEEKKAQARLAKKQASQSDAVISS